ncbi:MAG: MBL fold metallo-hydrolase [Candidatus Zixiibacteriota bacterium]|nr:MAG: MBL fold metallo-hydrolase [candidate division Zixibacteria bacterium]
MIQDVRIEVLYDNYPHPEGKKELWGFSCLISGTEKTILFDTGDVGDTLLANMSAQGVDPKTIDQIVISHDHYDHTGGLDKLLGECESPTVFLLESFSPETKQLCARPGVNVVENSNSIEICRDVYTTGEMAGPLSEQALILRTSAGLIVVMGCAHPGVVEMVAKAKELLDDDILFIMGGFHLLDHSEDMIDGVIASLQEFPVRYVAPTHCTGDVARRMFKEAYGNNFIEVGVGSTIALSDLLKK